jgi:protein SPT2
MTPAVEPEKAPKKGSFKDTLARAAAAQSRMGQVGKIQHKRIEKMPSRREREAILAQKGKAIQKGLDPKGKFGGTAQAQIRNGKEVVKAIGKVGNGKAPAEPEKKVKKAATATTGYTGTARPKTGAARPAARPGAIASSSRDRFKRSSARRDEYLSEDEEDEEMMEEEEEYSDESDMEAAAFEVDEEEEVAARIAKQEDREALEEENRLKREKLEKKRRLEAMAKKRPGQRF